MKLFNYAERILNSNNPTYDLELIGIGGDTGIINISKKGFLSKIKANCPDGIKLAIGITMYNENWDQFKKTAKGVFQTLSDLY